MKEGFYEQIITQEVSDELDQYPKAKLIKVPFNKDDGSIYINRFFQNFLSRAFANISTAGEEIAKPRIIDLSNKIIQLICEYGNFSEFSTEKIAFEGDVLKAFFHGEDFVHNDLLKHFSDVFPFSGLSESELFSGSKAGISLESEIKKEMLSSDEVWWLVSFIKFEGIRLFEQVFKTMEQQGKKIKIISTVYMWVTDLKAIDFLSKFANIEIKISYNSNQERLHAKSYIFIRETGFHTGYIGSSNISRTALTNGLEWNLKITQQEIPHIIDKCRSTFLTYWNDPEFILYEPEIHRTKLSEILNSNKTSKVGVDSLNFFTILPYPFQQEILNQLENCRNKGQFRNLIVAATGTGKTVMAAFDFKRFLTINPNARFLFVAHREEILKQAQYTFRQILRDNDFGNLWVGNHFATNYQHLFVSIQTLNNNLDSLGFNNHYYDFIVIDEVHHSAANSYQKLLEAFQPKILLGLTATPERFDGNDIFKFFDYTISAEIRLPDALNRRLLCPFQYFGLSDNTDISSVSWRKGRYDISELEKIYSEDDRRVLDILNNCNKYLKDISDVRALCFCVSKKHACFMKKKFLEAKLNAEILTSDNSEDRNLIIQKFRKKEINYLFVVDILNEGVDIPEIDTILLLRPTESMTIFLQQLGRGLRLHENKEYLTVLDFIGQSNIEYSFEHKFRGMIGKTHTKVIDEIRNDFPHLPLGCSIVLERTAKEIILNNISQITRGGKTKILTAIRKFLNEYDIECTLKNFCELKDISIQRIYETDLLWYELLAIAKSEQYNLSDFNLRLAKVMARTWLSTDSESYFSFILNQIKNGFKIINSLEDQWLLMLYYDIFDSAPNFYSSNELCLFFDRMFSNADIKIEIRNYFELRLTSLIAIESNNTLPYETALKLHGRYTRNQILVGLGKSTLCKKHESREGVMLVNEKNTEILFVTLDKSEGKFNPSTMYHDYFINDSIFHWQSQNATSSSSPKGKSYIEHKKNNKVILLFIREATNDENGLTMAFVFCGELEYSYHTGSKPMSIVWNLQSPPPALLLYEGKKLAVG